VTSAAPLAFEHTTTSLNGAAPSLHCAPPPCFAARTANGSVLHRHADRSPPTRPPSS
jgi:hypothetical protein